MNYENYRNNEKYRNYENYLNNDDEYYLNNDNEYYSILNLPPDTTFEQIKRAYRTLSMKYHPDKNPDNDSSKFNAINKAYQYFSNKFNTNLTLSCFDHSNHLRQNRGSTNSNTNANANANANANTNANANANSQQYDYNSNHSPFLQKNISVPDIVLPLNISYSDSFFGANLPITITRKLNNSEIINDESETETIYVKIPKGIDNNEIINIQNKGNIYNNIQSNVKLIVNLTKSAEFSRNGLDLIYNKTLSFKESLTGFSFNLHHINNKIYKISNNMDEIVTNNYEKIFNNLGFERDEFKGNLIIKFNVDYPKHLPKNVIQKLRDIL